MGYRAKVIFGLLLFFVIIGLRFLCANCQQIVTDIIIEDEFQPQLWQNSEHTERTMIDDSSELFSYQEATQISPNQNYYHRRRRPGARKRRRRPEGTTEINERNSFSQRQIEDEALNDSFVLTIGKHLHYYSSTVPNIEQTEKSPVKIFGRPTNKIERIREPLAALEQEQRLSELRTKQRNLITTETSVSLRDKSYRKPYSQAKRQGETFNQNFSKSGIDLKDILKNAGGLSLSEILQQQNLSLDDLIKGKQNALLALQTPSTPLLNSENRLSNPLRRIPITYISAVPTKNDISVSQLSTLSSDLNSSEVTNDSSNSLPNDNQFATSATPRDSSSSKRSALKPLEGLNRVRLNSTSQITLKKTEFEKEMVYQESDNQIISTKATFNTNPTKETYRKILTIRPTYKLTTYNQFEDSSSINSKYLSTEELETQTPYSKSGLNQLLEPKWQHMEPETNIIEKFTTFEEAKAKNVATSEEIFRTALKQDINNYELETITPRIDSFKEKAYKRKPDVTESNPSLFADIETGQTTDDRTDLLELMQDRRSGGRLNKILVQRNMTLDELIAHRQRGSSQLHLAEIVQNKTGSNKAFSIRPQILDEKLDIVTAFDNFPHFNLGNLKSIKPDEIKTDSQGASYFTSIIDIKPTDEIYKEGRAMKSLITADLFEAIPTSLLTSNDKKSIDFYSQTWKTVALPVTYNSHQSKFADQPTEVLADQISQAADEGTSNPAAQIGDEVARAHDLLDLELSGHGFRRSPVSIATAELPIGIRSAIMASALIVLFSLMIFLVVFVVCRWKQKHRKKLSYAKKYNSTRTRLPIISRQLAIKKIHPITSPIIFPGSKNKRINTMDPNSPEVQEYLFDTMRKPF